ncbi:unnamed protein product [Allacma fusca]|uniref:Uncharacterized protein n=1 Tax=Allacma fusca TaxID=39272 RepID=A0A8J2PPC1_9HEXA|nr:unnamed protein product [Allacma fusca]
MNSYANFPAPRPTLPDVIEVGGMHTRPPKPLPKDLEEFVSGAEHGFIYFSFGSIVRKVAPSTRHFRSQKYPSLHDSWWSFEYPRINLPWGPSPGHSHVH